MAARKGMLYIFLYNKWYFDELYDFLFVRPAHALGRFLWKVGDGKIIDGLGPDGIAARVLDATRGAVRLQSGYVYHYAFAMLIGVVALRHLVPVRGGAPMSHCPSLASSPSCRWSARCSFCCARGDARSASPAIARWVALIVTLADLCCRSTSGRSSTARRPAFQFVEQAAWLGGGITYHMGVDGISMLFVVLTAILMPFCILASWKSIENRVAEYMIAFLVLETLMIGVFCALDLVLFYVFFEGGLIPMFLIIGVWGGKRRVYASFKFFLYTLLGSVLMLLAILCDVSLRRHHRHRDAARHRAFPGRRCRPGCGSRSSRPSR